MVARVKRHLDLASTMCDFLEFGFAGTSIHEPIGVFEWIGGRIQGRYRPAHAPAREFGARLECRPVPQSETFVVINGSDDRQGPRVSTYPDLIAPYPAV